MVFSGLIALVIGMVFVLAHNIWVKDWPVLITIFGWLGLLKGVSLIFAPKAMTKWSKSLLKKREFIFFGSAFYLVFGLILGWFGYFV